MKKREKHFWDDAWTANKKGGRWEHRFWKDVSPEISNIIHSQSPEKLPSVLVLGCGLSRNAIAFAKAG